MRNVSTLHLLISSLLNAISAANELSSLLSATKKIDAVKKVPNDIDLTNYPLSETAKQLLEYNLTVFNAGKNPMKTF